MLPVYLPRPVAVCSSCHVATCATILINYPHLCGDGLQGIWRIALSASNWEACRLCNVTGTFAGKKCDICDGSGWIFIKPST
jgi:DnaJ-class molecular chaperone